MKTCPKCGNHGPFGKNKGRKDGLQGWCKRCLAISVADWQKRNAARRAGHYASFYWKNVTRLREESCNRMAIRRAKDPEADRAAARAYAAAHREEAAAKSRAWYHANKARAKLNSHARRARLAKTESSLTLAEWREILEVFDHRCAYCLRNDLPLSVEHVVAISRGGTHTADNVVPACLPCNLRKHDRTVFAMVS